jgi:cyclopropane-fatty-acyl-phospholipid synthase
MFAAYAKNTLEKVGVTINGGRPHDIQIHHPAVLRRAVLGGFKTLGEDYQMGRWDCKDIPGLIKRMRAIPLPAPARIARRLRRLPHALVNLQNKRRAAKNVEAHYDWGNEFYEALLYPTMQYSCAYFKRGANSLEAAQRDKMQLLGEKLMLKPGMSVLDIGCGWGELAAYLEAHFGVTVVGISLSKRQLAYANEKYADKVRQGRLSFLYMDYRDASRKFPVFDRVVSVGMAEHVGEPNLGTYFNAAYDCLKPGGIFVYHSIVGSGEEPDWISTYIFPGGMLPRLEVVKKTGMEFFAMWDEHCFGEDYARTLQYWKQNFLSAWPRLVLEGHAPKHPRSPYPHGSEADHRWFKRTEILYLDSCTGGFLEGGIDLCQLVFAKRTRPSGYVPVR